MTKSAKIIWIIAIILAIASFAYNARQIPTEEIPPLAEGEYYCAPQFQENAKKLIPEHNLQWELDAYKSRIENASSVVEAQRLLAEATAKIENYNRQINEYNEYLRRNCK